MLYQIHDFIDVYIDPRVNKSVIDQINFQILYFKKESIEKSNPFQIKVKPFQVIYSFDDGLCDFHLVQGVHENSFIDPINKIAYVKKEFGYEVYADTPFLINILVQFILIEQGISLIHAAAVADPSGNILLLPGAGGVGKTTLLSSMIKEQGYRLLGDDIVGISKDGRCYSFPRSFVLKDYHRDVYPEVFRKLELGKSRSRNKFSNFVFRNLVGFIKENMPFLGLSKIILKKVGLFDKLATSLSQPDGLPYLAAVRVDEIFGRNCVLDKGIIKEIIFLERFYGNEFIIEDLSEDSLAQRMFSIIHHEWVEVMRQIFSLGALEIINLHGYFTECYNIIQKGIFNKKIRILLIPDKATPLELTKQFNKYI